MIFQHLHQSCACERRSTVCWLECSALSSARVPHCWRMDCVECMFSDLRRGLDDKELHQPATQQRRHRLHRRYIIQLQHPALHGPACGELSVNVSE